MKEKKSIISSFLNFKENKKTKNDFREIERLFGELEEYSLEIKAIKPHKHFKLVEIEEQVNQIIDENPRVLTYQNKSGFNIGFLALMAGSKDIAMRVLDNNEAATQQSKDRENIGMFATYFEDMEDVVLKALDNKEAASQQSKTGYDIAMRAADNKMKKATLKSLEKYPENIGHHSFITEDYFDGDFIGHYDDIYTICTISFNGDPEIEAALKKASEENKKRRSNNTIDENNNFDENNSDSSTNQNNDSIEKDSTTNQDSTEESDFKYSDTDMSNAINDLIDSFNDAMERFG